MVGLPDDEFSHRVHAIIVWREDCDEDVPARHVAEHWVGNKVPYSVERVDVSLRNEAGNVRRSAVPVERIVAQNR